ncbi:MAG: hypothetical protein KDA79_07080 [Planctomycetaceae bacterium]|nr:hypothetical protein [Planctomycetaceae bacterium]
MKPVLTSGSYLRQLFAALTEHTFHAELGVADPQLTEYLTDLQLRFVKMDAIFRIRDTGGRRLEELAEMMVEAEARQARPQREVHRHIGDFALFWSGMFPEALKRLQSADRSDHLLDYREQGKRAYYIASTFDDGEWQREATVLRRLSSDFEMCCYGLGQIRREWENLPNEAETGAWGAEAN